MNGIFYIKNTTRKKKTDMANKKKKVVKAKSQKKIVKKTTTKKNNKKVVKKPVKKVIKKIAKKTSKPAKKAVLKKATVKKNIKVASKKQVPKKAKPIVVTKSLPKIDYSKAISPLGERLVVKLLKTEKVTAGGIIIPDSVAGANLGHLTAKVLAVGSGSKNKKGQVKPLDVQVGDVVLFAEYAGTKIEFNSEELHIVNESDVVGIVEG